tara:strand:+ start:1053 stop:1790 length:738 start_codon:yes stop_codon:yes gene_type:complete
MSSELNSVQESIKLALDAADAATDVTSEYSQVKREHKKLESKVSQIHKYTTITFVTAMAAAIAGIGFSAVLYFKTLGELRLMTKTNREGLVVFAENIDDLNTILIDLNVALKQQAELVALNKESSDKMTKMMELIEQTSSTLAAEMQASTAAMAESNKALSESLSTEVISKAMGQNNQLAVKLASMEAVLGKSIKNVEGKLVKNAEIGALSAAQKNTSAQVEMLAGQNVKILRLLEVQQDRISFP